MAEKPIKIRASKPDADKFPDLGGFRETILRDSAKVRKVATLTEIKDRHSNEHHHNQLVLKTWTKSSTVCTDKPDKSISLSDQDTDEIGALLAFLSSVVHRDTAAELAPSSW